MERLRNIYFQHGWGLHAATWQPWNALLKDCGPAYLDRGYWDGYDNKPLFNKTGQNLMICHSLGLHFCQPWFNRIDFLVIISGFIHFHGSGVKEGRFSRRHIKRMSRRLADNPLALLADFYRDCASPLPPPVDSRLNIKRLKNDLELLDKSKLDIRGLIQKPCLILHGAEDRIVPKARAHALHELLPMSRLRIIQGAGHGLPFTHSAECWRQIMTENIFFPS
ncbi:alpha/beta fold hydrolase [Desulfobacterota bacterium M19]